MSASFLFARKSPRGRDVMPLPEINLVVRWSSDKNVLQRREVWIKGESIWMERQQSAVANVTKSQTQENETETDNERRLTSGLMVAGSSTVSALSPALLTASRQANEYQLTCSEACKNKRRERSETI